MIVPMKRVTLVAHKADEEALLSALQATNAVQVIEGGAEQPESVILEKAESRVQRLKDALATMRPFAAKKGMLTPLPEAGIDELNAKLPEALSFSDELAQIARELASVRSEIDKNETLIASLRPWEHFPNDMQTFQSARSIHYFTGILPAADEPKMHALDDSAEYQFYSDGAMQATVVACANEDVKSVAGFLKALDWVDYAFPKLPGTPAQAMRRLEERNHGLTEKKHALEKQLTEKASGSGAMVEKAYDAAVIERDRALAAAELERTEATFHLEGWTPEDKTDAVEQAVRSATDAFYFDVRDPEEGEIPPSVVHNNSFVTPFEQVTNLYSRPDPSGIDGTPYMAPFYVLLFGLMLSDTGYGLLLTIASAIYVKLKKPTGMFGGIMKVLFWGGISTMVWGVLVGTFFGLDFDVLFGTNNVFPLLVDPMDNPIGMLILCFGLGVLHILFGVGIKMKMSFDRGDWQTAIFDNLSWILIVLGLIAFGGAGVVGVPTLKTVGLVAALAGALMILLFKGRAKRNPFSRTISGLGELYQVTSYLSDILSYARLFALGIATGVIASVFNDLCGMLMSSPNILLKILGVIVACALLVALHLFNLAINTLGAFVHCARLQYVEFYGKFYEAGGKEFKPLGYRAKHVRLTDAK